MDEGDDLFVCDGHGWQYEKRECICATRPDFRMKAFLVAVQENHLRSLGARRVTSLRAPRANKRAHRWAPEAAQAVPSGCAGFSISPTSLANASIAETSPSESS